jgi:cytochrome c553
MNRILVAAMCMTAVAAFADRATAADSIPAWAYPVNPPGLQRAPDDGIPRHVPNSAATYSVTQIRDLFTPPDWHPSSHPAMPDVVGRGKKPGQFACGFCHLPNGLGRPENSSLAGLSADYIAQQVADFKSGARRSSEPASLPINLMISVAQQVSEDDTRIAAAYFASLVPVPWIRVVETEMVPKTKVDGWMLVVEQGASGEPLGVRIVETPEDLERTELRDSLSGFVAYVPVGSVGKGEVLVREGNDRTTPCAVCHGAHLKGLGPVPALAGRSPSYLVRQLVDLQRGVRHGPWAPLMKSVVERLTLDEMVSLAAYAASLPP